MSRVLAASVALVFALVVLASPAVVEAKPKPRPTPTPTVSPTPSPTPPLPSPTPTPTPTIAPTPLPSPTPSPAPGYATGVDVSYHQGTIDWGQVAGAGLTFAYIRASAGTLTADSMYGANRSAASAAGLRVGAYHFANPDTAPNDAANEASWFLRNAAVAHGDLVPVLDFETSNGLDAASLTTWAQTWLTQVEAATGIRPVIYTNSSFWSASMANTDWFALNGYRLWIASWTSASQPTMPAANWAGTDWTFWQSSSTAFVPGVTGAVDADRFAGTSIPSELVVP